MADDLNRALTAGDFVSPWGAVLGSARLKAMPEDFVVEEVLGFAPDGQGEHLWLWVEKRGLNTEQVVQAVAAALNLPPRQVSYAGLKDRQALTRQWLSVHWPGGGDWTQDTSLHSDGFRVLAQSRSQRKLRQGAHAGNRFEILLRQVTAPRPQVDERLQQLALRGAPNHFGLQRFGWQQDNIARGLALLTQRQQGRRRRPGVRESLWLSAVRSALFNQVLDRRVRDGSWDQYLPGDVLQLDGRHSFFVPTGTDPDDLARLSAQTLHVTGPLPGAGRHVVTDAVARLEAEVLAPWSDAVAALTALDVPHQRRALRVRVGDLRWQWLSDETLQLGFVLTAGAFATGVLSSVFSLDEESPHALPAQQ